jgi:hypothetical protein
MALTIPKKLVKDIVRAAAPPPPPSHSGGTSGNLSIPGYVPKTPTVAYNPSEPGHSAADFAAAEATAPASSPAAHAAAHAERVAAGHQAAVRQQHLVTEYVTKAFSTRLRKQGVAPEAIDTRIEKAKSDLNDEREKLLNHPAVQEANAEGKVVGAKGLQSVKRSLAQSNPLGLSSPLTKWKRNPNNPLVEKPRKDVVAEAISGGINDLSHIREKGERASQSIIDSEVKNAADLVKKRVEDHSILSGEVNPKIDPEEVQIASLAFPASDAAKLAERGAEVLPKLLTEGGAKQVAKDIGGSAAARATAARAAVKSIPSDTLDAVKAAPKALRELPDVLRTGANDAPDALRAAARSAPGAAGRGALKSADSTAHSLGGLGAIAATQKAGIHTAPGAAASAFLEGTEEALRHHPGETLKTTARVLPGFITGPADVGIAAGQSAIEGSPKPLEDTVGSLAKGTVGMVSKLASGDPQQVEETVRKEIGLSPFVPLPAVLAKLHGSDLYEASRGKVRGAVEDRRAKQRAKQAEAAAGGKRYHDGKEIKQPIPVSGRDENYVLRGLGTKIEGHKARANVALDSTRADTLGSTHAQIETNRLLEAVQGRTGASRLARKMGREYEGAVSPISKMGIPHSTEGHALMKHLADYYGDGEKPVPGSLTDRMAANAAVEHPELFSDAKHEALTKAFHEQADRLANLSSHHSERARRIAQNDFTNHLEEKAGRTPVLKPEERITETAAGHTSPEEAAASLTKQAASLRKRAEKSKSDTNAAALRGQADDLEAHAGALLKSKQVSRQGAWAHYADLKAEVAQLRKRGEDDAAHKVEVRKQALYAELKDYTNPAHKLDTSKLDRWSPEMVDAFAQEQDAVAARHGLGLPAAYVADKKPIGPTTAAGLVERPFSARATHVKTGDLAKSGEASARFEDLLHHSVVSPRTRIAYNQLVHDTLNETKVRVRVGDGYKHVLTEPELQDAINSHHWPANTKAIPIGVVKQALTGEHAIGHQDIVNFLTKIKDGGQNGAASAIDSLPSDLKDEVLAAQHRNGTKYVAVNEASLDELIKQFKSPEHSNWRKAANVPTRLILNDPAWVFAQVFAKGIPIASALGPDTLLHAPRAIKAMAQIQKMDPESQARIMSMVGSSAGVLGTPHGIFTARDPYSDIRAISHSSAGKKVWELANGNVIGKWDRWNAAKMREYAAAVRSSKGFRNWYGGFKGLDKSIRDIAEKTKGMSPADRLDYISKHPEMARALQRNLNRTGGNWNSFTAAERKVAPFVIFYPWMRYSLNWTFHTFPVDHPVAATALAFLAQQNANELQKLSSTEAAKNGVTVSPFAELSDPLDYADPITQSGSGQKVFPVGTRISPTLGVSGTAITTGKLSDILDSTNPLISTAISIGSGKDLYTGEDLKGNVFGNIANQLLTLSPAVRGVEGAIGFHGFNKGPRSAVAEAYEKLNPGKTVRSIGTAYSPQSGRNFALENALSRIETTIGKSGKAAQSAVLGDETQTVVSRQEKVAKLKAENAKAYTEREKLLAKIDPKLAAKSAEEYERYKASEEEPGSSGGIYGTKKATSSIYKTSALSSSIYGKENSKALQYRPPSEGLHIPGLNLSGVGKILGDVASPLSSLVGGTKAQAADLPKGKQKVKLPNIEGFEHADQKEFAQYLSHYSKLPPKLAGEWVKQEGGGYSNGGEAGKNNWLGVGYPAHPTSFSQSPYFNGSPKRAAKATAEWMEGKIGSQYGYQAAPSIQGIARMAKEGAPESEIRAYIEGPSAWGTGAISQSGITVDGKTTGTSAAPSKQTVHVQRLTKKVASAPIVRKGEAGTIRHGGGSLVVTQTSDGPANIKKNLEPQIAARLLMLSAKTGKPVYVISGARTPQHSVEVGGSADDPHTLGEAMDIGVGAPSLASALAIPESVYESVGLYRPFLASMGSAEGNHVQIKPGASGKVSFAPGAAAGGTGTVTPTVSTAQPVVSTSIAGIPGAQKTTPPKAKRRKKTKGLTATQRLRLVEQIASGNLSRYGIPGFSTRTASAIPGLNTALEAGRQELAQL